MQGSTAAHDKADSAAIQVIYNRLIMHPNTVSYFQQKGKHHVRCHAQAAVTGWLGKGGAEPERAACTLLVDLASAGVFCPLQYTSALLSKVSLPPQYALLCKQHESC
jgi:hypothetical protein